MLYGVFWYRAGNASMDESHKLVQVYGPTTVNPPSVDTYNGLSWEQSA